MRYNELDARMVKQRAGENAGMANRRTLSDWMSGRPKAPSYVHLPKAPSGVLVKVEAHRWMPLRGYEYLFVLHREPGWDNDLMMVSEASTGLSLGVCEGAWNTVRKFTDGYRREDLGPLIEQRVREVVFKYGEYALARTISSRPIMNFGLRI